MELTTAISLGIATAILIPYYIQNKVYTIPEFLELRYCKQARMFFSATMLIICIVTKMAFCLYAGSLVLHSLIGCDIMTTAAVPRGDHCRAVTMWDFRRGCITLMRFTVIMLVGSALVSS